MKTAKLINDQIVIGFGGSNFTQTLEQVRELQGRRFSKATSIWTAFLCSDNISLLKQYGFDLDDQLLQWQDQSTKIIRIRKLKPIPGLKHKLFPYQHRGVEFIQSRDGNSLLGDEQGLGKTIQALAWLVLRADIKTTIIICPSSVKYNWMKEANDWTFKTSCVVSGKKQDKIPKTDIVIINYDIIKDRFADIIQLNPDAIILDEVQYISNTESLRTKAVVDLTKRIQYIVALSGTPITSFPIQFYTIISILRPSFTASWWDFGKQYCLKSDKYGLDFKGAINTEELHKRIAGRTGFMIRRKKEEVLKDLPPKRRAIIPIKIDNMKEYLIAEKKTIKWMKDNKNAISGLAKLEELKQIAVKGKMKQMLSWVEDFINTGEKIICFSTHKITVKAIEEKFKKKSVKIDGSVPTSKRQLAVDKFQTKRSIKVFNANIKAGGVGITLTAASNNAFFEISWTPADHEQAEARCHRIGQKDSVTSWYFIAKNTIEEKVMLMLENKSKVLGQVLDGKSVDKSGMYSELLKMLKKPIKRNVK